MDVSFGARLRAQRERRQVSLAAISDATKIKLSILEGLERDDVSQWPEGIYRRAYVRAYARALGLDPDAVVREFLEAHPDPVVAQPPAEAELEDPQWPAGIRRLLTSAIAAIPSRRQRDEEAAESSRLPAGRPGPMQAAAAAGPASTTADVPEPSGERREARPEAPPAARVDADRTTLTRDPDLPAVAAVCSRLARVRTSAELAEILGEAAAICQAVGLIVWSWDSRAGALRPVVASGYADATLARLPHVQADADNAIAAAFRSDTLRIVSGSGDMTGAVAVPLASPDGCVGVLAIELRQSGEQRPAVRAFATILAAQLVALVGTEPLARASNE